MDDDKKDNPEHNPGFVTQELCTSFRAHMDTKIDSIKNAVYLTGAILGLIVSAWGIFTLLMG